MFDYIKDKWINRKVTEIQVYSLVPLYLTQAEADNIVATPQKEIE